MPPLGRRWTTPSRAGSFFSCARVAPGRRFTGGFCLERTTASGSTLRSSHWHRGSLSVDRSRVGADIWHAGRVVVVTPSARTSYQPAAREIHARVGDAGRAAIAHGQQGGEQPPIKLLELVYELCSDAAKLNSSVCANCSGPPVDPLLNRSANHQLSGWRANWIAVESGQHIPKLGRQSIRKAKTLEVLVQPQSMTHFVSNDVLRDITPAVAQIEPSHFVVA